MKYYLTAGRNFSLSYAELVSVIPQYLSNYKLEKISQTLVCITTDENIDELFKRLGGFLSYGEVIEDLDTFLSRYDTYEKIIFGISVGSNANRGWSLEKIKDLSEEIKEGYKKKNISAKYILPTSISINAISVEKNQILEKGFLLEIFEFEDMTIYGRCIGVQNVNEYSEIEYDKPFTDKKMGVLPAKLCKMLINLSGLKPLDTVWDPFCGSGTLLLSAFSMGFQVLGSDFDSKAVNMATDNIEWYAKRRNDTSTKYNLFTLDVLKPNSKVLSLLRNTTINGLVCEPYMGPPQLSAPALGRAKELLEVVGKLYGGLFDILEHLKLSSGFMAVIIIPSYKTSRGWVTLSATDIVGKKWECLNKKVGGDLHWMRDDSIIRRNIFILRKKS